MESKLLVFLVAYLAPTLGMRIPHIIGGTRVSDPSKYPWQGSLQFFLGHNCGCALISSEWAVTAAHCMGYSEEFYQIGIGSVYWKDAEIVKIKKIIVHEHWKDGPGSFPNDIALLNFDTISEDTTKKRIRIASDEQAGNSDCYITGWGLTTSGGGGGSMKDQLHEAKIAVYTNTECKKSLGSSINDGHVCVGDSVNGRGSCKGDSGGPLVCRVGSSYQLIGVASWGISGCYTTSPSVYTRLSYFRQWINKHSGV